MFDSTFPGEDPEGARRLVEKVRAAVNIRFQGAASKPDTVFVDRGAYVRSLSLPLSLGPWVPVPTAALAQLVLLARPFPSSSAAQARPPVASLFASSFFCPLLCLPGARSTGRGFYFPATGRITEPFKNALEEHRLDGILGDNAQAQPGNMQEVLLHETAVSWMRLRLARTNPQRSWLETREQYGARLKRCCEEVNAELDVEGLCRDFPKRIKLLRDAQGGRIAH